MYKMYVQFACTKCKRSLLRPARHVRQLFARTHPVHAPQIASSPSTNCARTYRASRKPAIRIREKNWRLPIPPPRPPRSIRACTTHLETPCAALHRISRPSGIPRAPIECRATYRPLCSQFQLRHRARHASRAGSGRKWLTPSTRSMRDILRCVHDHGGAESSLR